MKKLSLLPVAALVAVLFFQAIPKSESTDHPTLNPESPALPADVKAIEDSLNLESEGVEDILDETKDTKEILHSYIDSLDTKVDRKDIKMLIDDLYIEAQQIA